MDWGKISPAIFGSLFQSVMYSQQRRDLGAHYTSEKNILKLIKPLFLDELRSEFENIKSNPNKLKEFHKKLSTLKFMDPACGCGNFLVISYRELRLLEIDILRVLFKGEKLLDVHTQVWIDVDQFYGIEIEEFPARISEVAMWLIDHQMNMRISEEFGRYFVRLPLKKSPKITNDNALRIDWKEIVRPDDLSYILGNPPFSGARLMKKEQKADMTEIFEDLKGFNNLDYVSAWYYKTALYIKGYNHIKVAFVSTNSITQGEQVEILWRPLFDKFNIKIHFAHRTFKWSNEARGNAGVFVVIIGFSNFDVKNKIIWDYDSPKSEAHEIIVKNINAYLVDANNIFISSRSNPLCDVPEIIFGSMPNDGGNFLLTDEEKEQLIKDEPQAKKYIRPLLSAREFLNGENRWCIWLLDANPADINKCPLIKKRINLVKQLRENSNREATRKLAETPSLFGEIRQPESDYIFIPLTTSENRKYIPIALIDKNIIVNNTCSIIPNVNLYHFGILTSVMHMAWMRYVCGKLEGRFRYSNNIVYNNFPWPKESSKKNIKAIEEKAQKVLDVRAKFPESSLVDLYDPLTMPPELVKAHNELDKAVDICYRAQPFVNDGNRIEYLFGLYNEYTEPLIPKKKTKRKK
jgi:calcineurin-like phosphoesterase family protein